MILQKRRKENNDEALWIIFLYFFGLYLHVFRRCFRRATQFLAINPHTPWKLAPWLLNPSSRPETRRGNACDSSPQGNAITSQWNRIVLNARILPMPRWLRKQKFVQSKLISDNCRLQQSMMRHSVGSKVVNYTGMCTRNVSFETQPKKNGGGMYPQDCF